jgi:carbon monoxide dehydrogenase subunit G
MKSIQVSRDVNAPASVVWSIIIDLEGSVDTISGIEKVEILSGGASFGVGTKWRETRTMFGKKATEEMTVTEITDGESYVVVARPEGANYRTVMSILPTGETACTVSMEFGANPKGKMTRFMGATMGKMFEGATRKALAVDLDDIATAAEAVAQD